MSDNINDVMARYKKYFDDEIERINQSTKIYRSNNMSDSAISRYFDGEVKRLNINVDTIDTTDTIDSNDKEFPPSLKDSIASIASIASISSVESVDLKDDVNISMTKFRNLNVFENEAETDQLIDMSKKENIDNVIIIDRNNFFKIIRESYKRDEDIIKQFLIDFDRTDISINSTIYHEVDQLFLELSKYNKLITFEDSDIKITIMILSMLLMCQSSFYFSFVYLYSKINRMKDQLTKNDDENNSDPRLNYSLVSRREKSNIDLIITNDMLECSFKANYNIIDETTGDVIIKVKTETIFNTKSDEAMILYEC